MTKSVNVLKEAGYDCEAMQTYVEVRADASEKMKIIKTINEAQIVMLDIE